MAEENLGTDPTPVADTPEESTPESEVSTQETVSKEEYEKVLAERDEQHGRATKAEAKLKEREVTEKPQVLPDTKTATPALDVESKVDLRLEGYSKEDIDFIERQMGNRSLSETLEDPRVKAGIEGVKKQVEAEGSTPETSSTVPTFTEEKKTWSQMSPEQRKANYQQALGRLKQAGGTRVE